MTEVWRKGYWVSGDATDVRTLRLADAKRIAKREAGSVIVYDLTNDSKVYQRIVSAEFGLMHECSIG